MKKYTLFILVLVFGLFILNANFTNVATADTPDCTISSTLRMGSVGNEVACLQTHLGLSADGNFGPKTKAAIVAWQAGKGLTADGVFGARSRAVWVANGGVSGNFPDGCQSASGYSITTGMPCNTMPPQYQSSVVISGVSGPQTLNVNQTGTWTVSAYYKNGGILSYSVVWGDESYAYPTANSSFRGPTVQQSATFTHSYSQAGIYTPKFTVTGLVACPAMPGYECLPPSANTSLSVNVGNTTVPNVVLKVNDIIATGIDGQFAFKFGEPLTLSWVSTNANSCELTDTIDDFSLFNGVKNSSGSVNINNLSVGRHHFIITCPHPLVVGYTKAEADITIIAATSTITVLSPNGGETWIKGTNKTIYWQSDKVAQYDVFLASYQAPLYTIAKNVYSSFSNFQGSYAWPVGAVQNLGDATIPNGSYTIRVCQSGTSTCDSSDAPFSIVSNTSPTCSSSGYDATTGFRCGCTSTSGFSSVDGRSCSPYPVVTPACTSGIDASTGFLCGCTSSSGWSSVTGQSCTGCDSTSGFSYLTGASCAPTITPTCSSAGYDATTGFRCGCTSTQGYSSYDGEPCWTTSSLPAGCTSTKGYSVTTGGPCGPYPAGCSSFSGWSSTNGEPCY